MVALAAWSSTTRRSLAAATSQTSTSPVSIIGVESVIFRSVGSLVVNFGNFVDCLGISG